MDSEVPGFTSLSGNQQRAVRELAETLVADRGVDALLPVLPGLIKQEIQDIAEKPPIDWDTLLENVSKEPRVESAKPEAIPSTSKTSFWRYNPDGKLVGIVDYTQVLRTDASGGWEGIIQGQVIHDLGDQVRSLITPVTLKGIAVSARIAAGINSLLPISESSFSDLSPTQQNVIYHTFNQKVMRSSLNNYLISNLPPDITNAQAKNLVSEYVDEAAIANSHFEPKINFDDFEDWLHQVKHIGEKPVEPEPKVEEPKESEEGLPDWLEELGAEIEEEPEEVTVEEKRGEEMPEPDWLKVIKEEEREKKTTQVEKPEESAESVEPVSTEFASEVPAPKPEKEPEIPVVEITEKDYLSTMVGRGLRNAKTVKFKVQGVKFKEYIESVIFGRIPANININQIVATPISITPGNAVFKAHVSIWWGSLFGLFKTKTGLNIDLPVSFVDGRMIVDPKSESFKVEPSISGQKIQVVAAKLRNDLVDMESLIVEDINKGLGTIRAKAESFDAMGGQIVMQLTRVNQEEQPTFQ